MEEIDVPSHFLCPISLQLMRDPVTVSSGITYDRENIEHWLFGCKNNTCPVTKQPLHDADILTPNHTLRRVIQSWCILNSSLGIERIPTPKPPVDKSHIVKLINEANEFPNSLLKCLQRLKSIASQSERNKKCLEAVGIIEYLASLMVKKNDSTTTETTIEILFDLIKSASESRLKNLVSNESLNIVDSLVMVLKCGNYKSRAYATVVLKSILDLADPIQLISVKTELFEAVVHVLQDQISQQASKAALKLLREICPWGRNRIKAVDSGAVSILIELLLEYKSPSSEETRACELTLIVLDQLCGCAEGRAELLKHAAGLAIVSKKILRVSHVASDRAVRILSSVCRFSATSRVIQEMLQVGVVTKLCMLLQVDTSFKTKERAKEILKLHSRVWKNSTCIPLHLLSSYPSS